MKLAVISALVAILSLTSALPQGPIISLSSNSRSSSSSSSVASTASRVSFTLGPGPVITTTTRSSSSTTPTSSVSTTSSFRHTGSGVSTYTNTSTLYRPSTSTSSRSAPTTSYSAASGTIRPINISQYTVNTGAVVYNTNRGMIYKNNGKTSDISTLFTFSFPSASAGKTCEFHFNLDNSASTTVSGSAQFDLFSSLKPVTTSTKSWPSGNQRNQYLGRLKAAKNGEASFVSSSAIKFACPTGTQGYELVGVNDVDDIEWNVGSSTGPYLRYY